MRSTGTQHQLTITMTIFLYLATINAAENKILISGFYCIWYNQYACLCIAAYDDYNDDLSNAWS